MSNHVALFLIQEAWLIICNRSETILYFFSSLTSFLFSSRVQEKRPSCRKEGDPYNLIPVFILSTFSSFIVSHKSVSCPLMSSWLWFSVFANHVFPWNMSLTPGLTLLFLLSSCWSWLNIQLGGIMKNAFCKEFRQIHSKLQTLFFWKRLFVREELHDFWETTRVEFTYFCRMWVKIDSLPSKIMASTSSSFSLPCFVNDSTTTALSHERLASRTEQELMVEEQKESSSS